MQGPGDSLLCPTADPDPFTHPQVSGSQAGPQLLQRGDRGMALENPLLLLAARARTLLGYVGGHEQKASGTAALGRTAIERKLI